MPISNHCLGPTKYHYSVKASIFGNSVSCSHNNLTRAKYHQIQGAELLSAGRMEDTACGSLLL